MIDEHTRLYEYLTLKSALLSHSLGLLAIVVSLISVGITAYFAWHSWHRSRSIYELKKYKFPKRVGESKTEVDKKHEKALNGKLKSGIWTVLYTYEHSDQELIIIIGKTKK